MGGDVDDRPVALGGEDSAHGLRGQDGAQIVEVHHRLDRFPGRRLSEEFELRGSGGILVAAAGPVEQEVDGAKVLDGLC